MEQEKIIDPATGIKLTPSYHGEECLGSGDHPGYECCCDECDYYLYCFTKFDWEAPCAGAGAPNKPSPGEKVAERSEVGSGMREITFRAVQAKTY